MTEALSRRAALVAGAAFALTGATSAGAQDEDDDVATLERLIELEQRAAVAYRAMADEGDLLDEEVRVAVEEFARQEDEHAEALIAALEDRGGAAPDPPRPDDVEGLDDLDSQEDALQLAIDLESALVRAYGDAAETFAAFELLKTCAQILGAEGQHLVVARQQLGDDPVPEAFETGRPAD